MEKTAFTKSGIAGLKPASKIYSVYDRGYRESVPGLLVRVSPGGTKAFQVYRKLNGTPVRVGLGRFPALSVEKARKKAIVELAKLGDGVNPNAERRDRREREEITLRRVLDDYCADRKLRPNTESSYRCFVGKYLGEYLDLQLENVSRDAVVKVHQSISSPTAANKTMRVLRALFEYAAGEYLDAQGQTRFPDNPVRQLSHKRIWHRETRRTNRIRQTDMATWFTSVGDLDPVWRDFLILLVLTGLRRREAQALAWSEVDLEEAVLCIPGERTKNGHSHTLPIPAFLLRTLERRAREADISNGADPDLWVFPSRRESASGHIETPAKAIARVRSVTGLPFSCHDLRRTFASTAEELGVGGYTLKRLLNHHTRTDVTQGYVDLPVAKLRGPMQRIEDAILVAAGASEVMT